jgi:hypothetical protein
MTKPEGAGTITPFTVTITTEDEAQYMFRALLANLATPPILTMDQLQDCIATMIERHGITNGITLFMDKARQRGGKIPLYVTPVLIHCMKCLNHNQDQFNE